MQQAQFCCFLIIIAWPFHPLVDSDNSTDFKSPFWNGLNDTDVIIIFCFQEYLGLMAPASSSDLIYFLWV